jgi:hypothetical protein
MKRPEIKDLTLREKIGQTCVFRHYLIRKTDDVKKYFTDNPIGASWVMGHSEALYEQTEALMENPVPNARKDEMHMNYVNIVN